MLSAAGSIAGEHEGLGEGPSVTEASRSYLLLDGVALKEVILAARRMNPEYATLYDRAVESEFVEMAPHVFAWVPQSRFAQLWLATGRGHGFGLRVVARAAPAQLVAHLQQFLLADLVEKDGAATQVYLRFFDPRVMHTLLRALRGEQLRAFFGPIDAFVVESDDDAAMDVVYRLDSDGQLLAQRHQSPRSELSEKEARGAIEDLVKPPDVEGARKHLAHFGQLQGFSSAQESATPFASICPCNAFKLTRPSGLSIDQAQHKLFSAHALRWYKRGVFDWLASTSAKDMAADALRKLIEDGYEQAQGYGITTQQPVREYLDLCVRNGLGFHLKPWAQKILKDPSLEVNEKLKRLKDTK